MTEPQAAFVDLKRGDFPFRLRLLRKDTRECLDEIWVHGPGAVKIPGYGSQGFEVLAEVTYSNGHQFIDGPGVHEARLVTPPEMARANDAQPINNSTNNKEE